ncbi:MAG: hypothetical protein M1825_003338 [Sarcosagium campestre]|nr:MAG: hypothetical protein M1825_003338 [Sarcosagium campestre]
MADPATLESSVFTADRYYNDQKKHLLLGATGSVATIKLPLILHSLSKHADLSIRLLLTPSATNFLAGQSAEQPPLQSLWSIPNVDGIHLDADEWDPPWTREQPAVLHIELRRWADLLVIAPLSADAMAKLVNGFSDSLLLSVARAWDVRGDIDGKKKRIIVAPAMNTAMWHHPVTGKHIDVLEKEWGIGVSEFGWIQVLRPAEKRLACGDVGDGAMTDWTGIVTIIKDRLNLT